MINSVQLQDLLANKYQLLVFEDLATALATPTTLYKMLESVYKQEYKNNERMVFYTAEPVTEQILKHLEQSLSILDISGFFCLICSPHLVPKYGTDPVGTMQIDLETTAPLPTAFAVPDTVCPLPWMHLEIRHAGDIYPCCVQESQVSSMTPGALQQALQGPAMAQLRSEFMSGQRPAGCRHCWKLEDEGLPSNRGWHVKKYLKKFYSEYFDNVKIRSLDIKPGNVCNFKCRICNPVSSSAFADEAQRTGIKIQTVNSVQRVEYNEHVWDDLQSLLPAIENLDFYGGEPFLVKQIPQLLQCAVDQGHADHIGLHFNSNGSIFPESLVPALLKFKSVDIALSIDDIGPRFELERGGSWTAVADNILKFKQLTSDRFEVYLMPTVNIQNVYYLDELLTWADKNQLRVELNFLDRPQWANIDQLTYAGKRLIANKYGKSDNAHLQNIAQRVATAEGSDGVVFVKVIKRFDQIRAEKFSATHPEIAAAMGY